MLSVNQINAQAKIMDLWKAIHDPDHPSKIEKMEHDPNACLTRSVANGDLKEFGKSGLVQSTFLSDASKAWNNCPREVKDCDSIWKAKKAIRNFVEKLPV